MRVLICGGGAIGASIAYFLSRRGIEAVVIERAGVANAASGKSGGFLALDWCDGGPLQSLARRSFALHARLAEEIDDDWGYRRLDTWSGFASARAPGGRGGSSGLGWLSDGVAVDRRLGSNETTAQVQPGAFTRAMMRAAEKAGAELLRGTVTGIAVDRAKSRVEGVLVDGEKLGGDAVVIAMGPWSILAAAWLPLPAVYGLKGHSLVFETGTRVTADALFLEYEDENGAMLSPEVFPRADGTTYVCAISSESRLPIDPAGVEADAGALERLEAMCRRLSPVLRDSRILARQACFRPVTQDGLPLIGAASGFAGTYVATGHSVWGMLNAPATGEALAELIADRAATTVDLSPFDPGRLRAFDAARLRAAK